MRIAMATVEMVVHGSYLRTISMAGSRIQYGGVDSREDCPAAHDAVLLRACKLGQTIGCVDQDPSAQQREAGGRSGIPDDEHDSPPRKAM